MHKWNRLKHAQIKWWKHVVIKWWKHEQIKLWKNVQIKCTIKMKKCINEILWMVKSKVPTLASTIPLKIRSWVCLTIKLYFSNNVKTQIQ